MSEPTSPVVDDGTSNSNGMLATLGRNATTLKYSPTQYLARRRTNNTTTTVENTGSGNSSIRTSVGQSPAELILTRCAGWLSLTRLLVLQFEEQTSLEKASHQDTLLPGFGKLEKADPFFPDFQHMAASHDKTLREWTSHPSHEREAAFKTNGNINDLMRNLRETTGKLSSEHEAVYKVLSSHTLPALKSLEKEIHHRMTNLLADEKHKRREKEHDDQTLHRLIKELKTSLVAANGTGEVAPWVAGDPFLIDVAIKRHLNDAKLRLRSDTSTLDGLTKTTGVWEQNLIAKIKSALLAYTGLSSVAAASHGATTFLEESLNRIEPIQEWQTYAQTQLTEAFAAQIDPEVAFSSDYPGSDSPLVELDREGQMLRKAKITKKWNDKYYLLTNAGWLHEFPAHPRLDMPEKGLYPKPVKSLWLKGCFISDLGVGGRTSTSEFHIEHRHEKKAPIGKKKVSFKYSTNSQGESDAWYTAICKYVPVEHGVRLPGSSPTGSVAPQLPAIADVSSKRMSTATASSDEGDEVVTPIKSSSDDTHAVTANPHVQEPQQIVEQAQVAPKAFASEPIASEIVGHHPIAAQPEHAHVAQAAEPQGPATDLAPAHPIFAQTAVPQQQQPQSIVRNEPQLTREVQPAAAAHEEAHTHHSREDSDRQINESLARITSISHAPVVENKPLPMAAGVPSRNDTAAPVHVPEAIVAPTHVPEAFVAPAAEPVSALASTTPLANVPVVEAPALVTPAPVIPEASPVAAQSVAAPVATQTPQKKRGFLSRHFGSSK
ncbi:hypothetical protein HKX48_001263 [Thoreauomyces humboldtii]|nr:hypothetical protein HKX48_001263 [Thoreauomyces humboldtii]